MEWRIDFAGTHNVVMNFKDHRISYNHFDDETALIADMLKPGCKKKTECKYLILNGDWREQYLAVDTLGERLDLFAKNRSHMSKWSDTLDGLKARQKQSEEG
jgi:hypothetical protein